MERQFTCCLFLPVWALLRTRLLTVQEGFYQALARTADGGGCFVPSTPVTMWDGSRRPIGELSRGQMLRSWDAELGPTLSRVTKVLRYHRDSFVEINITGGQRILATSDHPFHSVRTNTLVSSYPEKTLATYDLQAQRFSTTELFEGVAGEIVVGTIVGEQVISYQEVVNLELDRFHWFYAGGVRVHSRPNENALFWVLLLCAFSIVLVALALVSVFTYRSNRHRPKSSPVVAISPPIAPEEVRPAPSAGSKGMSGIWRGRWEEQGTGFGVFAVYTFRFLKGGRLVGKRKRGRAIAGTYDPEKFEVSWHETVREGNIFFEGKLIGDSRQPRLVGKFTYADGRTCVLELEREESSPIGKGDCWVEDGVKTHDELSPAARGSGPQITSPALATRKMRRSSSEQRYANGTRCLNALDHGHHRSNSEGACASGAVTSDRTWTQSGMSVLVYEDAE